MEEGELQVTDALLARLGFSDAEERYRVMSASPAGRAGMLVHLAARRGQVQLLRHLLRTAPHAAWLMDSKRKYQLPLHDAASEAEGEDGAAACRLLLAAAPGSVLVRDEEGETALHKAAACRNLPAMRILLEAAPEAVQMANREGSLPIHVLAEDIAEFYDDPVDATPVQLLLAAAPATALAPGPTGQLPGHLAATSGLDCALQALLDFAPEAALTGDGEGKLPLHVAACNARSFTVRVLLAAAPEAAMVADGWGRLPLHDAANGNLDWGDTSALQLLLAAAPAAALAADGQRALPIHWAAKYSMLDDVQRLLAAAPASVRAADSKGRLPLAYAGDREEVVEALIAAAPEALLQADHRGRLPLGWAAAHQAKSLGVIAAAAPETAMVQDNLGKLPLDLALAPLRRFAFCPRPPPNLPLARQLLPFMPPAAALDAAAAAGEAALPLIPQIVAGKALQPADWQLVPAGCPGLGAVLPAVAARSFDEAGYLVARLPAEERARLQCAALCLSRHLFPPLCACILVLVPT